MAQVKVHGLKEHLAPIKARLADVMRAFEEHSLEAKQTLIRLYGRTRAEFDLAPADLAITLFETPRHHRGIRGRPGDEAGLTATIAV